MKNSFFAVFFARVLFSLNLHTKACAFFPPSPHLHLSFPSSCHSPFFSCLIFSCFAPQPSSLSSHPLLHLPPLLPLSLSLRASSFSFISSSYLSLSPDSLHCPSPSYYPPTIPSLVASLHSLLLRIRESGSCPILFDMGFHCVFVCCLLFSLLRAKGR